MSRPQEVSTSLEESLHDTVNRREPLELSGRRETPHLALTRAIFEGDVPTAVETRRRLG